MVSVSRGVGEPSCFLVVVADSGESIEKSSDAAERLRRYRYHCTPKGGAAGNRAQGRRKARQFKELVKRGSVAQRHIYLLTIVVITSIMPLQRPGGGP